LNQRPTVYETVALPLSYIGLSSNGQARLSVVTEYKIRFQPKAKNGGFKPPVYPPAAMASDAGSAFQVDIRSGPDKILWCELFEHHARQLVEAQGTQSVNGFDRSVLNVAQPPELFRKKT
jgi:hypothetical protein